MFCNKCGKSVSEGSLFCMYCGNPLTETVPDREEIPGAPVSTSHYETASASTAVPASIPATTGYNPPIETRWEYQKYDEPYEKETEIAFVGFILLFISIVVRVISAASFGFGAVLSLLLAISARVIGAIWIAKVARNQNRDVTGWVIFAILLPIPAMIIMGFQRKLYAHPEINPQYDDEENARRIYNKAVKFYQHNRFQESYRFALKALELDPHAAPTQDLLNALYDHVNRDQ
jgi:hypothetical protein